MLAMRGRVPVRAAMRCWLLLRTVGAVLLPARCPLQIAAPGRVVAIGDVHGDFAAFLSTLQAAGLVDQRAQSLDDASWIGGDCTLVQTGDILDRGPDEAECMSLFRRLRAEAPGSGGQVIGLLGNHEVMNVLGVADNFVHPAGKKAFGPTKKHQTCKN